MSCLLAVVVVVGLSRRRDGSPDHEVVWVRRCEKKTNSGRAHTTADVTREAAVMWWLMTGLVLCAFVLQRVYTIVLEDGYLLLEQGPPQ